MDNNFCFAKDNQIKELLFICPNQLMITVLRQEYNKV